MSIREKVISKLTGNRALTSAEIAELDTLAVALELNDNDPYWAQVAWVWAVTPRKEWIDVAHRALAENLLKALKEEIKIMEQRPGTAAQNDEQLAALQSAIEGLNAKIACPPAPAIDAVAIKKAMLEALASQKKQVISSESLYDAVKAAARETFSWLLVAGAAGVIGLCLFCGMKFGEWMQSSKIQQLEQQVGDLTAALAKK